MRTTRSEGHWQGMMRLLNVSEWSPSMADHFEWIHKKSIFPPPIAALLLELFQAGERTGGAITDGPSHGEDAGMPPHVLMMRFADRVCPSNRPRPWRRDHAWRACGIHVKHSFTFALGERGVGGRPRVCSHMNGNDVAMRLAVPHRRHVCGVAPRTCRDCKSEKGHPRWSICHDEMVEPGITDMASRSCWFPWMSLLAGNSASGLPQAVGWIVDRHGLRMDLLTARMTLVRFFPRSRRRRPRLGRARPGIARVDRRRNLGAAGEAETRRDPIIMATPASPVGPHPPLSHPRLVSVESMRNPQRGDEAEAEMAGPILWSRTWWQGRALPPVQRL
jgi:hypothetical protein